MFDLMMAIESWQVVGAPQNHMVLNGNYISQQNLQQLYCSPPPHQGSITQRMAIMTYSQLCIWGGGKEEFEQQLCHLVVAGCCPVCALKIVLLHCCCCESLHLCTHRFKAVISLLLDLNKTVPAKYLDSQKVCTVYGPTHSHDTNKSIVKIDNLPFVLYLF